MKNNNYYGIGISETEVFKTTDNGKKWINITDGKYGNISSCLGRIIFGSSEDRGLTYSDDNGITIELSNITSGNWNNIIYSKDKKTVYASSMDKEEIAMSKDNGENWTITSGKFYDNKDGAFIGKDLIVDINDGINVRPNIPKYNAEDLTQNDFLLYILNYVVAPKIFMDVTGKRFDSNSKAFYTLKENSNIYYTNINKYINSRTLLDFEEDVGMRPFYNTLEDNISDEENIIVYKSSEDDNDVMKKTIIKVRKYIAAKKRAMIDYMVEFVMGTEIDNSNILNVSSSKEDMFDAVQMEKMYEGVVKGSVMSIMSTIYERIFNLPDSKIRDLIFAAIFEELNRLAPTINFNLGEILKKYKSGESVKDEINKMNLSYSFEKGLEIALEKYLSNVKTFIKKMTESEDDELKDFAISIYKEKREKYISEAKEYIFNIYISSGNLIYDNFNSVNNKINELDVLDPDYKNKIIAELIKYDRSNEEQVNKIIEYTYKEMLSEMQKINIEFGGPDEILEDINNTNTSIRYLKDINREFNKRCSQLLGFVYKNNIEKDYWYEDIIKYLDREMSLAALNYKSKIEKMSTNEEIKKFISDNKININNSLSILVDKISFEFKSEWDSDKEML